MKEFREPTEVAVGQDELFAISLAGHAGGGYRWEMEPGDGSIEQVGNDEFDADEMVGGGGRQKMKFRAKREGRFALRMVLKRSWESQGAQTREIAVSVSAKAQ